MPPRSPRPHDDSQYVTSLKLSDRRGSVKDPVSPLGFSLTKGSRSGLSLLEGDHRIPHKDGVDMRSASGIEAQLLETEPTKSPPSRRAGYTPLTLPIRPPSMIPMLHTKFFRSDFWYQFHAQIPLFEPKKFLSRLEESLNGTTDSLDVPGRLAAMSLVVWAASFGHNEEGKLDKSSDLKDWRLPAKSRTNNMVKELLYLIDSYGIIRKPTWDGLVALLTILPLTKETISNFERATMHKLTMNMVESLVHDFKRATSPEERLKKDLRPLARAFWWCVIQDWMVHCPSGERMILTTNDLYSLESLLPPLSPPADGSPAEKDSIQDFTALRQYFSIPLKLASAYRLVQGILSSPEFVRGNIDETRLKTAWSTLDAAWNALKTPGTFNFPRTEYSEYSRIWKLFIFECYNHLDIALNQTMAIQPERTAQLFQACNTAHSKCRALLKPIMEELRALSKTNLGQYDACGLSKPIYSAAALIARSPKLGTKDDFLVCLKALQQTRWVYSDHEKKVADLRFLWNVSRDEPLDDPSGSPKSLSSLDGFDAFLLRQKPIAYTGLLPMYSFPGTSTPPSPPFSPLFRSSSPAKSARSRGSSGGSFCISEGHNSPEDDVPSRKSPSALAREFTSLERKNQSS